MPLPRWVARFNDVVTNRVLGPLAPHLPGFGVIVHAGRRSGRTHRTPVNVFDRPGGYLIALTYGAGADWVKNVIASGGCVLETRGRPVRLTRPRVVVDQRRRGVPLPVRLMLGVIGASEFLELSTVEGTAARD